MAKLPLSANTGDNKEKLEDFSAVPAGKYISQIVSSEYVENKDKTGNMLRIMHKVIMGSQKGRKLMDNLNLDNPNPVAVQIANKALNSMCDACGKVGVDDSEELHGIPIQITVTCDEESKYPNSITAYEPVPEGAEVEADSESEVAKADPGSKVKGKLPWQK